MKSRYLAVLCLLFSLSACDFNSMRNQPRFEEYEETSFFRNETSSRLPVEGTVARGQLQDDDHLYSGKVDGRHAETFPFEVTAEVLSRGKERYEIYCSVCHDTVGYGRGMVVRRGFKQPTSFHEERLRNAPPGYFFEVITKGFGAMYDYAAQVKPHDRWAIIAYIKALQLSQNVPLSALEPEERTLLDKTKTQAYHGSAVE